MTIADLIKSIFDSTNERIKTPISGAFICSFIVYNWRPIFVLMFSNASIEDKIVVINYEYCRWGGLLFPFCIAVIYTAGVPILMLKIDKFLRKTKEARVDNIYDAKDYVMDRKIQIARKDFLLKNVESGSKEVEELLDQIESLKETNSQILEANNNTVNQLNEKLKQSNEIITKSIEENNDIVDKYSTRNKELSDLINDLKLELDSEEALKKLDSIDINVFKIVTNKIGKEKIGLEDSTKFARLGLIEQDDKNLWHFTKLGKAVKEKIESDNFKL